ncbi:MAG: hypothetical protein JWP97_2551 [Labilithrix sp.]|nr:hypothetical protein [Labilithrix sp.]
MSMKRAKAKTSGKDKDAGTDFWAKPVIPEKTWEEATADQPDDAFTAYSSQTVFTKGQLISHPKFGKGFVTEVESARIEILFQDGKKKLGLGQS